MAMGIVSDADFEAELLRENSVPLIPTISPVKRGGETIEGEVVESERPGRSNGDVNVPESLRKIIGETSEIEGRQEAVELARQFGISPSSVSAYANGSNSTATYDKRPNLSHINDAKERVSKRARAKLMQALNKLTPEKLEDSKAVELAAVARAMSGIVKDMEPDEERNGDEKSKPQFLVYAPQIRDKRHYEITVARDSA